MSMLIDGDEKIHVILREFPMFEDPKNPSVGDRWKGRLEIEEGKDRDIGNVFHARNIKNPAGEKSSKEHGVNPARRVEVQNLQNPFVSNGYWRYIYPLIYGY